MVLPSSMRTSTHCSRVWIFFCFFLFDALHREAFADAAVAHGFELGEELVEAALGGGEIASEELQPLMMFGGPVHGVWLFGVDALLGFVVAAALAD